jgi:hypothetical protein
MLHKPDPHVKFLTHLVPLTPNTDIYAPYQLQELSQALKPLGYASLTSHSNPLKQQANAGHRSDPCHRKASMADF